MCTCSSMHKVCFNCVNIETTDHLCPLWSNNIFGNFPQNHRVHGVATPLSGVHSIKVETLAQSGESGGCTPTPFHYIYHHVKKSCGERSSWEGRYTPPIFFYSTPICTLFSKLYTRKYARDRAQGYWWKGFRGKEMRECANLCTVHVPLVSLCSTCQREKV